MSDIVWPNGTRIKPYVSSGFGPRRAPIAGASTYHRGTDFSHTFSLLHAVADGVVVAIDVWPALGFSVWIQHDGFFAKYGHMKNRTPLKLGEKVQAGRIVGVMGKTGTATDTHLHFEITPGRFHAANVGQVDPVTFISNLLSRTAGGGSASKPGTPSAPEVPEEDDMKCTYNWWVDAHGQQQNLVFAMGGNGMQDHWTSSDGVYNTEHIRQYDIVGTGHKVNPSHGEALLVKLAETRAGKG